eukprot:5604526-Alexandrium_andersonii.AAC.1
MQIVMMQQTQLAQLIENQKREQPAAGVPMAGIGPSTPPKPRGGIFAGSPMVPVAPPLPSVAPMAAPPPSR